MKRTPVFTDDTVQPETTYNYTFAPVDAHLNEGPITAFSVRTPPAGHPNPRRVGVRPTGACWGGPGEQIDMLSGNVNFTLPLFKAVGRGNWGVTFALSYNSQLWRQDSAGQWKLGRDTGFGC